MPTTSRTTSERVALALDILPTLLWGAGLVCGLGLAIFHGRASGDQTFTFLNRGEWQLDAFAAFGTMSGFSLAALALIASLSGHKRAEELLDDNHGRFLVRTLVHSTCLWFVTATLALACWFSSSIWLETAFLMFVPLGVAGGAVALVALVGFFRRYSEAKPE